MPTRRIKRKGFLFDLYEWMEKHCVEFLDDDVDVRPGLVDSDGDKVLSSKKTRRKLLLLLSSHSAKAVQALKNDGYIEGTDYVLLYEVERVYQCRWDCIPAPLAAAR